MKDSEKRIEFVTRYEALCRKWGHYVGAPGNYGVQIYPIWGSVDRDFEKSIGELYTDIGLE